MSDSVRVGVDGRGTRRRDCLPADRAAPGGTVGTGRRFRDERNRRRSGSGDVRAPRTAVSTCS